jgi:predicted nucleic acid-binding protein
LNGSAYDGVAQLLVVSDTGPLHYLVLTGDIALLPKLFGRVLAPQAVRDELANPEAPAAVRAWITQAPAWLEVRPNPDVDDRDDRTGPNLDRGERAAIALALAVKAGLVLMDDQAGVTVARRQGLAATGTLGILDVAARRGLVDLAAAFERLKATSFYYRQGLLDALLAQRREGGNQ